MLDNLKRDWKHYAVVALVTTACLATCYHTGQREVVRQDRIGTSLLHLAPRSISDSNRGRSSGVLVPTMPGVVSRQRQPYIPPEAQVKIVPLDPSKPLNAKIEYHEFGFCFKPGLELAFAPLGVGVDAKWVYVYRFGATTGLNYFEFLGHHDISPTVGITYHISKTRFQNTDLLVGYAPTSFLPYYGALRVSF